MRVKVAIGITMIVCLVTAIVAWWILIHPWSVPSMITEVSH